MPSISVDWRVDQTRCPPHSIMIGIHLLAAVVLSLFFLFLSLSSDDSRRTLPPVVEAILDSLQQAQVLVGGALTSQEAYSCLIQPLLLLLLKALNINNAREYIEGEIKLKVYIYIYMYM